MLHKWKDVPAAGERFARDQQKLLAKNWRVFSKLQSTCIPSRFEIDVTIKLFQKSVYTFFEALAICHTVQVAGSYEEDEDRADEELSLLNVDAEIPPIFHKSLDELHDIESVHEEIDFISSKHSVTFERNGGPKPDESRPFSDAPQATRRESLHKRPLSLSNIQLPKSKLFGPDSPSKQPSENLLLRQVQQQEYKRTVSYNINQVDGAKIHQRETMTHRRTQSSIPFGTSGELMGRTLN